MKNIPPILYFLAAGAVALWYFSDQIKSFLQTPASQLSDAQAKNAALDAANKQLQADLDAANKKAADTAAANATKS